MFDEKDDDEHSFAGELVPTVTSMRGNGRVARLARWFSQPPRGVHDVQLLVEDDEGRLEVLDSWPGNQIRPDLATEINDSLLSHVEETGRNARGKIRMRGEGGDQIAAREVRMAANLEPGIPQVHGDGSMRDVTTQLQGLLQGVMGQFVKSQQYTFNLLARQAETNAHLLLELRKQMRRADTELATAKAEVAVAMATEGQEDDKITAEVIGLLRDVLAKGGSGGLVQQIEKAMGGSGDGQLSAQIQQVLASLGGQHH